MVEEAGRFDCRLVIHGENSWQFASSKESTIVGSFPVLCFPQNNVWRLIVIVIVLPFFLSGPLSQVPEKLYHIMLCRVHLAWTGFKLTMLVVIGIDCIGSYKSNYHTITMTDWILIKFIHKLWIWRSKNVFLLSAEILLNWC
jgi:hypothetical protein